MRAARVVSAHRPAGADAPGPGSTGPPGGASGRAAALLLRCHAFAVEPSSERALAVVGFLDASVLPLAPEALLGPMALARGSSVWRLAAIAAMASWVGGLYGYALGHFAAPVLPGVLNAIGLGAELERALLALSERGWAFVLVAAFVPVPWKLFAVGGGLLDIGILPFALASFVGRGLRFGALALPLALVGSRLSPVRTGRLLPWALGSLAWLGAGFAWFAWGLSAR